MQALSPFSVTRVPASPEFRQREAASIINKYYVLCRGAAPSGLPRPSALHIELLNQLSL